MRKGWLSLFASLFAMGTLFAGRVTVGAFTYTYSKATEGDGVMVTSVALSGAEVPPKVWTFPSSLDGEPVTEIGGRAIANEWYDYSSFDPDDPSTDYSVWNARMQQWLKIEKVIFPETLERTIGEPQADFFAYAFNQWWNNDTQTARCRKSLELEFWGPPCNKMRCTSWWDGEDDEVYAVAVIPEESKYYEDWMDFLEEQADPYLSPWIPQPEAKKYGVWHDMIFVGFTPKLGEQFEELKRFITSRAGSDANKQAVAEALSLLIDLSADKSVRKALSVFGYEIVGDVWSWDDFDISGETYQPNTLVDAVTGSAIHGVLADAIDALGRVETTWEGELDLADPAGVTPLLDEEGFSIDVADAKLLKATLEGVCASAQLAKSYDLKLNWKQLATDTDAPSMPISTIKENTSEAWANVQGRCSKEGVVSLQMATCGNDLYLRFSSDEDIFAAGAECYWVTEDEETWEDTYVSIIADPDSEAVEVKATIDSWMDDPEWSGAKGTCAFFSNVEGRYGFVVALPGMATAGKKMTKEIVWWSCLTDPNTGVSHYCKPMKTELQLLQEQANFGKKRRSADSLPKAREMTKTALTSMTAALELAVARTDTDAHLFNLPLDDVEITTYKGRLEAAIKSLDEPMALEADSERIYLGMLFSAQGPTLANLPEVNAYGAFDLDEVEDPSWGGVFADRDPPEGVCPITVIVDGDGTVTGGGDYELDKTVKLSAKANKGSVFAGWYDADDALLALNETVDPRATSYSFELTQAALNGAKRMILYAKFVLSEDDTELEISCDPNEEGYTAGKAMTLPIEVTSASLPKVKVSGLPSGLKYNAKTGKIEGTPKKPGYYTVTISATNTTVKKVDKLGARSALLNLPEEVELIIANQNDLIDVDGYDKDQTVALTLGSVEIDALTEEMLDCLIGATASGLPKGLKWNKTTGRFEGYPTVNGKTDKPFTVTFKKGKEITTITMQITASKLEVTLKENAAPTVYANEKTSILAFVQENLTITYDEEFVGCEDLSIKATGLPKGLSLKYDKMLYDFSLTGTTKVEPGAYLVSLIVTDKKRKIESIPCKFVLQVESTDEYNGEFYALIDGDEGRSIVTISRPKGGGKAVVTTPTKSYTIPFYAAMQENGAYAGYYQKKMGSYPLLILRDGSFDLIFETSASQGNSYAEKVDAWEVVKNEPITLEDTRLTDAKLSITKTGIATVKAKNEKNKSVTLKGALVHDGDGTYLFLYAKPDYTAWEEYPVVERW